MTEAAVLAVLAAAAVATAQRPAREPQAYAGNAAHYQFLRPAGAPPDISRVIMTVEPGQRRGHVWWTLAAYNGRVRLYTIAMHVRSLGFLGPDPRTPDASRYLLRPADGPPIEYVDGRTGRALLPATNFAEALLPHADADDDEGPPFFVRGTYLGHPLKRLSVRPATDALDLTGVARLTLDPDLMIGTGRNFKDEEGRRLYVPGQPGPEGNPDYAYTPYTADDYREMIDEVGTTLFTIAPEQLPYVINRPVFFIMRAPEAAPVPELLYRSNYLGSVMFMDEPAWLAQGDEQVTKAQTPQDAARRVVEIVRDRHQADGNYGMRNLHARLQDAGYDFGDAQILQPRYPVWETLTSAAWYEMQAGVPGYVFEGRYSPPWFAGLPKANLGVDFPATVQDCLAFHYAFYRGAARHFGARWGVAIYGQMSLDVVPHAFPAAYREGASYLWFWSSDHSHHVPFVEQKAITRALRDYVQTNPREKSAAQLTRQATVAVALPWGYLLDDHTLAQNRMWFNDGLALDRDNGHGATYRDVLRAAAGKAAQLLSEGTRFDFVFWSDDDPIRGYRVVYRILENGTVVTR